MVNQQTTPNGAKAIAPNVNMDSSDAKRKSNGVEKDTKQAEKYTDKHDGHGSASNTKEASPKKATNKRRKVNHACVYCRRSHMTCDLERPCARCIKRDIGHLCHDEPREMGKRQKSEPEMTPDKHISPKPEVSNSQEGFHGSFGPSDPVMPLGPPSLPVGGSRGPQIAQPKPMSPAQFQKQPHRDQPMMNFDQWNYDRSNNLSDMDDLHTYNTFNTHEVSSEYNILGDFLNNSLLDDGRLFNDDTTQNLFDDPLITTGMFSNYTGNSAPQGNQSMNIPNLPNQAQAGNEISRPSSAFPIDQKARDKFFLTAADPAGNDSPEERMNRLLKAKYDAGMLKPFNYVKGYARLNNYMEKNMRPASRQKILRQLDKFRPKFREAMQTLTDIQLLKVEMWFERSLMEYDRVFASMAIPACCWRRTGEIFRGNKEMAELIHVPIEQLREGKLTIHEIIAEDSLVSYWEKFGAIAFDQSQKAILTSCSLKNPDPTSKDPTLRCCFSFTIRRDTHNIPAVIVGNFLPIRSA